MNKSFLLFLSTCTLAVSAYAKSPKPNYTIIQGLENPVVEVSSSNGLAAVQPGASLKFGFASCGKLPLSAKVSADLNTLTVLVVGPKMMADCPGPVSEKSYDLQISSDFKPGTLVYINNPLKVVQKQPAKPVETSDCKPQVLSLVKRQLVKDAKDVSILLETTTRYLGGESYDGDVDGSTGEYLTPFSEYYIVRDSKTAEINSIYFVDYAETRDQKTNEFSCRIETPTQVDKKQWKKILETYN